MTCHLKLARNKECAWTFTPYRLNKRSKTLKFVPIPCVSHRFAHFSPAVTYNSPTRAIVTKAWNILRLCSHSPRPSCRAGTIPERHTGINCHAAINTALLLTTKRSEGTQSSLRFQSHFQSIISHPFYLSFPQHLFSSENTAGQPDKDK